MIIFSDLHLDNYSQFSTINEQGLNTRLYEQIKVIFKLCEYIKEHNVQDTFFLGDLYNSLNESMPKVIYQVSFDLIKNIQENTNLVMLVGNHDIYQNIHLFTPFKSLPNVKVVYHPQYYTVENNRIACFPWGTFKKTKKKYDLVLGHFGIRGADVGSGVRNLNGEIDKDDLECGNIVVAGHYHTMQESLKNKFHVGSIMPHKFSDGTQMKGFFLYKDGAIHPKFIDSPSFNYVEINSQEDIDGFAKNKKDSQDYYKLILKGQFDIPEFNHRVMVTYNKEEDIADRSIDLPESKTFVESVHEFINKSLTQIDKDLAKKYITEIIREEMKGEEL